MPLVLSLPAKKGKSTALPETTSIIKGKRLKRTSRLRSSRDSSGNVLHHLPRLPARTTSERLVQARGQSSKEFTIRRRNWRRGTWIYLSSGESPDTSAYYVEWSSFTPRKPTLTMYAGSDKEAPVVGTCRIPRLGHRLKVKVGDRISRRSRCLSLLRRLVRQKHLDRSIAPQRTEIVMRPERAHYRYPGWTCEMSTKPAKFHRARRILQHSKALQKVAPNVQEPTRTIFRWTNAPDGRWMLYLTDPATFLSTANAERTSAALTPSPIVTTDSSIMPTVGPTTEEDKQHVCILRMTDNPLLLDNATQGTPQASGTAGEHATAKDSAQLWERAVLLTALAGRFREMRSENRGTILVVNRNLHEGGWVFAP